ncbi:hypothetical protein IAT38_004798 [Cryptococcus sp. DSM 104549]
MSVVSKNLFDLLGDDDESPAPAPKAAAPKKVEAAPAKAVPGSAPRGGAAGGARGRGSYPTRGAPRNVYRGDDRPVDTEAADAGFDGERVAPPKRSFAGRDAHTKGPRGNRPARGTSGGHTSFGSGHYKGGKVPAQAGERRQFERRNQNGGTDSQKKVEHGWGANTGEAELKDEVEGEKDAETEEAAPQTPAEGGWGADNEAPATTGWDAETPAAAEAEPEEPEEVTKSYDEYLAEKAAAALEIAGLGKKQGREVSSEIEGKAFVKEGIDEFFSGKAKTEAKHKAPKKEKVYIEVDGQFAQPAGDRRGPRRDGDRPERREGGERSGRGRGARGGFGGQRGSARGGAGARAPRGGRAPAAINANDTTAFPALGA